jgi:hypothetical protein
LNGFDPDQFGKDPLIIGLALQRVQPFFSGIADALLLESPIIV